MPPVVPPLIPILIALSVSPHNNGIQPMPQKSHMHSPRFISPPTLPLAQSALNPLPYHSGLTPSPSPLRPHCLAKDRLLHWRPSFTNIDPPHSVHPILSEADFDQILNIIDASWGSNTKATYGAGLLVFHVFCDSHNVPEIDRCPVSQPLLLSFISTCSISDSHLCGFTIQNLVCKLVSIPS